MADQHPSGKGSPAPAGPSPGATSPNGEMAVQTRIWKKASGVRILDPDLARSWIRQRQAQGLDGQDEVWDGVYVVLPLASNPHQNLVGALTAILHEVIASPGKGQVLPGANVSDRRAGWEDNFRVPDVVVVLKDSRAVDSGTHWMGGPDFLIEIQSPGDDTEQRIGFYGGIQMRELLVLHWDTRRLRLFRHAGRSLALAGESDEGHKVWLSSEVVPLSFRWKASRAGARTGIKLTGRRRKTWTV